MGRRKKCAIVITEDVIELFEKDLVLQEKSENTIRKYVSAIREFGRFLDGKEANKETALEWKNLLLSEGKVQAATINVKIAAMNAFFLYLGHRDYHIKLLNIQKKTFRDPSKDLTKEEYEQLIDAAKKHDMQAFALVIETLGSTGMRVSELKYLTVEAVQERTVIISMKGKIRTIILPKVLVRELRRYAKKKKIRSGQIFVDEDGKCWSARKIWGMLKKVAKLAGVAPTKVFPHNLRHLFAREYDKKYHDIVKLADILGHSSIETTRLYLISTGEEHAKQIDDMNMVKEDPDQTPDEECRRE